MCTILEKYGLPSFLVKNIAKLNKNCTVKIRTIQRWTVLPVYTKETIYYVSSPPFAHPKSQVVSNKFLILPREQNGNAKSAKVRLINQNTSAKGTIFNLQSSFYFDDSFLLSKFEVNYKLQ